MKNKYDVIIVGGGIFGAAIFYYLSSSTSKRVLLIEKKRICNGATGSSGGFVRLLHSSSRLCNLSAKSFEEFNQFEKKVGFSCGLVKTGFFTIDLKENLPVIEDNMKLIKNLGLDIECLTSREAVSRFGFLKMPITNDNIIIYEKNSGYADPVKTCRAYLSAGVKLGGDFLEDVEVIDVLTKNGTITGIKSSYSNFEAPCVVLATGSWTGRFLEKIGCNDPIFTKKIIQTAFFKYPINVLPFPTFSDKTLGLYGRDYGGGRCLIGLTEVGEQPDHDSYQLLSITVNRKIKQVASKFASWINDECWVGGRCGVDAYTKDCEGKLEFLPEISGLLICSGWSGVGFKIAPECAKQAVFKIENF